MTSLFPSILSTRYFDLEERLNAFSDAGIDWIHLDVMDGHFVNNISFGPSTIPSIRSAFSFSFDSHLMVTNPQQMVPLFLEAGSDWVSFHLEAESSPRPLLRKIRSAGAGAGLVINPDTPLEKLFPHLEYMDYALVMSVFPGYGGQSFIPATMERIARLKEEIRNRSLPCLIQVDGGVKTGMAKELRDAGADLLVMGTALYNAENVERTVTEVLQYFNGEEL